MLECKPFSRIPHRCFGLGLSARDPPQYGVDERSCPFSTALPGKRYARIHCCMVRNAIETRKLIRAEAQDVLQVRRNARPATWYKRRNLRIQGTALSQYSGSELVCQSAVWVGQLCY